MSSQDDLLRLLQDPLNLPLEFKSWLVKYLEVNPPSLPVRQMLGYKDSPLITSGSISDGPPSSPSDGDIWIATGIDANGTVWNFRYNAGSSSAYKWEFVGGSPLQRQIITGTTVGGSSNWYPISGSLQITLPRGGDYFLDATAFGTSASSGAETLELGYGINSVFQLSLAETYAPVASVGFNMHGNVARLTGRAANDVVAPYLWHNGTTSANVVGSFTVTPIRIS